ncbi:GPI-anchored surface protein, putative [Bodo saltans]|uniref:GPI-anchored surface protein, putative n=1 Tax=Bodo saltans TaxID=75058 RepID=A0A0S4JKH4_BODSA|nr:GPI-anchored surface protein, putative [Bodo saltans]|eukprot:CUG90664.1 GPI-anchored surface protein, putative [Bodo saltans]
MMRAGVVTGTAVAAGGSGGFRIIRRGPMSLISETSATGALVAVSITSVTSWRHSSSSSSYESRADMLKEVELFRTLRRNHQQSVNAGGLAALSFSLEEMASWDSVKWESVWKDWQRATLRGGAHSTTTPAAVPPSTSGAPPTVTPSFVFRFDAVSGQKLSGATCVNISNQLTKLNGDLAAQAKSAASVLGALSPPPVVPSPTPTTWGTSSTPYTPPRSNIDSHTAQPPAAQPQQTEGLSSEQLILKICQLCPYWFFSHSVLNSPDNPDAPLSLTAEAQDIVKKRTKLLTPLFPGVVAKNDLQPTTTINTTNSTTSTTGGMGEATSDTAAPALDLTAVDIPLFVSLACLSEDHRQDFYNMYPLRSTSRNAPQGRVVAAKNRHVIFRDNAFSYVHTRAENDLLDARHSARYNTYSWVPLQEIVTCRQKIVANLAVHNDDARWVAQVLSALNVHNKTKNWTKMSHHFSVTNVDEVRQHLEAAMRHVTSELTMMGETKTCFVVPLKHAAAAAAVAGSRPNSSTFGGGSRNTVASSYYSQHAAGGAAPQGGAVEHLLPLAFAIGHL